MVPPVREKERGLRSAGSAGIRPWPQFPAVAVAKGGHDVRPTWTISILRLLVVGLLGILTKRHVPAAMGTPQNYDSRIYTCCGPWKGARGSSYLTTFKPAFVEALHLQTDDYSSLFTHLAGLDMGGNAANAPPFPAAAGGAAAGAVQQAEYRRKAESAYSGVHQSSKQAARLTYTPY